MTLEIQGDPFNTVKGSTHHWVRGPVGASTYDVVPVRRQDLEFLWCGAPDHLVLASTGSRALIPDKVKKNKMLMFRLMSKL